MRELRNVPTAWAEEVRGGESDHREQVVWNHLDYIKDHQNVPIRLPSAVPSHPWVATELTRIMDWVKKHELQFEEWPPEEREPRFEHRVWYSENFRTWAVIRRHFLSNPTELSRIMTEAVLGLLEELQPTVDASGSPPPHPFLTVPLYELVPDVPGIVDRIYRFFTTEPMESSGLFNRIKWKLKYNHHDFAQSKHVHGATELFTNPPNVSDKALMSAYIGSIKKRPSEFDVPVKQLVEAYFKETPFRETFTRPIHLPWRFKERMSHTHVIGRTDSGKTVLIERMIHQDLLDPAQPSLVVMTPHGDLIRSLRKLASPLSDKMIVIDPTDENYPPAINPFSTKRRVSANSIIKTFDYVLTALDLELTAKQRALWKPTIRMLLSLPFVRGRNATILDIRDFMIRPETYRDVIDASADPSFFYDNVFVEKPAKSQFDSTRAEIGYRLGEILSDPALRKVLGAEETKIDFYDELQNRHSVILIDTAKRHLSDGSSLFGGMMLALIFQAIFARDDIADERKRHPTFIYIDEAANFLSDDISDMLTELRKFRCGLVLVHHELAQAQKRSTELARSLVSQPSIRFAAPSAADAPALAAEMGTEPELLRNLPHYHFAAFIRGVTPHPIPVKVQPLRLPTMSVAAEKVALWRNRDRTSLGMPPSKPKPEPSIPSPEGPDEEVSRNGYNN